MSIVFEPNYCQQCRHDSAHFEYDSRTGATKSPVGAVVNVSAMNRNSMTRAFTVDSSTTFEKALACCFSDAQAVTSSIRVA
jgi:hypothetical protein